MMKDDNRKKPEWAPQNSGDEFASRVNPGINKFKSAKKKVSKRKKISVQDYVDGVKNGNLTLMSKAITLVESNSQAHFDLSQSILSELLPYSGKSIRVAVTGPPGSGKSTFIESIGKKLCAEGHKVAVLAIDPTSSLSRGSILGDKTRMEGLSREKNAFIRPSPSGGTLGGVARKTRETTIVCEAAGYDVIFIETVGVGQSEVTVRSMVDFFLLMLLPGGGDELQGIKKGIVELADLLIVNKADGNLEKRAMLTKNDYANAVHMIMPATEGWTPKVLACSAIENKGIQEVWENIQEFIQHTKKIGIFDSRRKEQMIDWLFSMLDEGLRARFYENDDIVEAMPTMKEGVLAGHITPTYAAMELLKTFFSNK